MRTAVKAQWVQIGLVRSWSALRPIRYLLRGCPASNGQRNSNQEWWSLRRAEGRRATRRTSWCWQCLVLLACFLRNRYSIDGIFLNPQMAARQSALNRMLVLLMQTTVVETASLPGWCVLVLIKLSSFQGWSLSKKKKKKENPRAGRSSLTHSGLL